MLIISVLAQYLFRINGHTPTAWELKGVAVAGYNVAVLCKSLEFNNAIETGYFVLLNKLIESLVVAFNTKFSYWFSNGIGIVKVLTLVFISITGLVVLGGHTKVPDPKINFTDSFEGTATAYGITNAIYKIIFSYAGFENAFNVVNEINVSVFG